MSRIPTYAFGRKFTHIPEFVREDLDSFQRESVLYADHWIEELNDFRHVRIPLLKHEAEEYARRCWAYELFLRAGGPKWAKTVPRIDKKIAKEADNYSGTLENGIRVGPPYLCFAAFLGKHLEALSCGGDRSRTTVIELQGRESALFTVGRAIQALTPTIRTFNSREKSLRPWKVTREDDVRDLLYVMLKPVLFDLTKEEPTPSHAGMHKFVDLISKAARIFIEVKWIGKRRQWKAALGQIQIDIQSYPSHLDCETIIFVIVDAIRDIPDPRLVEQDFSKIQYLHGRKVDIRLYIVEP